MILKLLFIFMIICNYSLAAAPTRQNTYISGSVIDPVAVMANENAIFTYLQSGVDTYSSLSITNAAISTTAGITYGKLSIGGGIQGTDINGSSNFNFNSSGGNFEIGTAHSGDLLVDNGTTFTRLVDSSTIGEALISQGSTTAPIYGFPSGQLGSWTSAPPNVTTIYQASTDGIAMGVCNIGPSQSCTILSDSNSSPSTIRSYSATGTGLNSLYTTLFTPVKKNDYYEFTVSGGSFTQGPYFIAIGS